MKHCILGLTILTLAVTTATAMPISAGYLMISGGPESESAGFGGETSVLIIPVPDYTAGSVLTWDPSSIPDFDGAWVDDSQVWFLGGDVLDFETTVTEESILFLSQDANQDITLGEKESLLWALRSLLDRDPGGGELPEPFALGWSEYSGFVFGDTGVEFPFEGPVLFPRDDLGPIQLSVSVGSPSTEVDIIEHSPPNGLPIRLFIEADANGSITGMSAVVLPEPGAIALFVVGLAGLGFGLARRRRRL